MPITAPTRCWRFSASYDSFVVQQTFALVNEPDIHIKAFQFFLKTPNKYQSSSQPVFRKIR